MFVGFSDITAIRSGDAGAKWNKNFTGITENSVYHVIKNFGSGKLYAATSSAHDMYQSTYLKDDVINGATGRILTSLDNGANWTVLHDFADPVIRLAFDPLVANKMYAAVINSTTAEFMFLQILI